MARTLDELLGGTPIDPFDETPIDVQTKSRSLDDLLSPPVDIQEQEMTQRPSQGDILVPRTQLNAPVYQPEEELPDNPYKDLFSPSAMVETLWESDSLQYRPAITPDLARQKKIGYDAWQREEKMKQSMMSAEQRSEYVKDKSLAIKAMSGLGKMDKLLQSQEAENAVAWAGAMADALDGFAKFAPEKATWILSAAIDKVLPDTKLAQFVEATHNTLANEAEYARWSREARDDYTKELRAKGFTDLATAFNITRHTSEAAAGMIGMTLAWGKLFQALSNAPVVGKLVGISKTANLAKDYAGVYNLEQWGKLGATAQGAARMALKSFLEQSQGSMTERINQMGVSMAYGMTPVIARLLAAVLPAPQAALAAKRFLIDFNLNNIIGMRGILTGEETSFSRGVGEARALARQNGENPDKDMWTWFKYLPQTEAVGEVASNAFASWGAFGSVRLDKFIQNVSRGEAYMKQHHGEAYDKIYQEYQKNLEKEQMETGKLYRGPKQGTALQDFRSQIIARDAEGRSVASEKAARNDFISQQLMEIQRNINLETIQEKKFEVEDTLVKSGLLLEDIFLEENADRLGEVADAIGVGRNEDGSLNPKAIMDTFGLNDADVVSRAWTKLLDWARADGEITEKEVSDLKKILIDDVKNGRVVGVNAKQIKQTIDEVIGKSEMAGETAATVSLRDQFVQKRQKAREAAEPKAEKPAKADVEAPKEEPVKPTVVPKTDVPIKAERPVVEETPVVVTPERAEEISNQIAELREAAKEDGANKTEINAEIAKLEAELVTKPTGEAPKGVTSDVKATAEAPKAEVKPVETKTPVEEGSPYSIDKDGKVFIDGKPTLQKRHVDKANWLKANPIDKEEVDGKEVNVEQTIDGEKYVRRGYEWYRGTSMQKATAKVLASMTRKPVTVKELESTITTATDVDTLGKYTKSDKVLNAGSTDVAFMNFALRHGLIKADGSEGRTVVYKGVVYTIEMTNKGGIKVTSESIKGASGAKKMEVLKLAAILRAVEAGEISIVEYNKNYRQTFGELEDVDRNVASVVKERDGVKINILPTGERTDEVVNIELPESLQRKGTTLYAPKEGTDNVVYLDTVSYRVAAIEVRHKGTTFEKSRFILERVSDGALRAVDSLEAFTSKSPFEEREYANRKGEYEGHRWMGPIAKELARRLERELIGFSRDTQEKASKAKGLSNLATKVKKESTIPELLKIAEDMGVDTGLVKDARDILAGAKPAVKPVTQSKRAKASNLPKYVVEHGIGGMKGKRLSVGGTVTKGDAELVANTTARKLASISGGQIKWEVKFLDKEQRFIIVAPDDAKITPAIARAIISETGHHQPWIRLSVDRIELGPMTEKELQKKLREAIAGQKILLDKQVADFERQMRIAGRITLPDGELLKKIKNSPNVPDTENKVTLDELKDWAINNRFDLGDVKTVSGAMIKIREQHRMATIQAFEENARKIGEVYKQFMRVFDEDSFIKSLKEMGVYETTSEGTEAIDTYIIGKLAKALVDNDSAVAKFAAIGNMTNDELVKAIQQYSPDFKASKTASRDSLEEKFVSLLKSDSEKFIANLRDNYYSYMHKVTKGNAGRDTRALDTFVNIHKVVTFRDAANLLNVVAEKLSNWLVSEPARIARLKKEGKNVHSMDGYKGADALIEMALDRAALVKEFAAYVYARGNSTISSRDLMEGFITTSVVLKSIEDRGGMAGREAQRFLFGQLANALKGGFDRIDFVDIDVLDSFGKPIDEDTARSITEESEGLDVANEREVDASTGISKDVITQAIREVFRTNAGLSGKMVLPPVTDPAFDILRTEIKSQIEKEQTNEVLEQGGRGISYEERVKDAVYRAWITARVSSALPDADRETVQNIVVWMASNAKSTPNEFSHWDAGMVRLASIVRSSSEKDSPIQTATMKELRILMGKMSKTQLDEFSRSAYHVGQLQMSINRLNEASEKLRAGFKEKDFDSLMSPDIFDKALEDINLLQDRVRRVDNKAELNELKKDVAKIQKLKERGKTVEASELRESVEARIRDIFDVKKTLDALDTDGLISNGLRDARAAGEQMKMLGRRLALLNDHLAHAIKRTQNDAYRMLSKSESPEVKAIAEGMARQTKFYMNGDFTSSRKGELIKAGLFARKSSDIARQARHFKLGRDGVETMRVVHDELVKAYGKDSIQAVLSNIMLRNAVAPNLRRVFGDPTLTNRGEYDEGSDRINVLLGFMKDGKDDNRAIAEAIFHEQWHNVTVPMLRADKNFERDVTRILETVRKSDVYKDNQDAPELAGVEELLAYAFSSKEAMLRLSQIKYAGGTTTAWKSFVNAVKRAWARMTGIGASTFSDTAFGSLFELTHNKLYSYDAKGLSKIMNDASGKSFIRDAFGNDLLAESMAKMSLSKLVESVVKYERENGVESGASLESLIKGYLAKGDMGQKTLEGIATEVLGRSYDYNLYHNTSFALRVGDITNARMNPYRAVFGETTPVNMTEDEIRSRVQAFKDTYGSLPVEINGKADAIKLWLGEMKISDEIRAFNEAAGLNSGLKYDNGDATKGRSVLQKTLETLKGFGRSILLDALDETTMMTNLGPKAYQMMAERRMEAGKRIAAYRASYDRELAEDKELDKLDFSPIRRKDGKLKHMNDVTDAQIGDKVYKMTFGERVGLNMLVQAAKVDPTTKAALNNLVINSQGIDRNSIRGGTFDKFEASLTDLEKSETQRLYKLTERQGEDLFAEKLRAWEQAKKNGVADIGPKPVKENFVRQMYLTIVRDVYTRGTESKYADSMNMKVNLVFENDPQNKSLLKERQITDKFPTIIMSAYDVLQRHNQLVSDYLGLNPYVRWAKEVVLNTETLQGIENKLGKAHARVLINKMREKIDFIGGFIPSSEPPMDKVPRGMLRRFTTARLMGNAILYQYISIMNTASTFGKHFKVFQRVDKDVIRNVYEQNEGLRNRGLIGTTFADIHEQQANTRVGDRMIGAREGLRQNVENWLGRVMSKADRNAIWQIIMMSKSLIDSQWTGEKGTKDYWKAIGDFAYTETLASQVATSQLNRSVFQMRNSFGARMFNYMFGARGAILNTVYRNYVKVGTASNEYERVEAMGNFAKTVLWSLAIQSFVLALIKKGTGHLAYNVIAGQDEDETVDFMDGLMKLGADASANAASVLPYGQIAGAGVQYLLSRDPKRRYVAGKQLEMQHPAMSEVSNLMKYYNDAQRIRTLSKELETTGMGLSAKQRILKEKQLKQSTATLMANSVQLLSAWTTGINVRAPAKIVGMKYNKAVEDDWRRRRSLLR